MHRVILLSVLAVTFATLAPTAFCVEDSPAAGDEPPVAVAALRAAIDKAIPLLEKGSAGSADQRTCFTCHSQAVPILALAAAKQHGFAIDQENFARQLRHTAQHLEDGRERYLDGRGQGGQVITAGYALWALAAGGEKPNETTAAVTGYLLTHQGQQNHWKQPSQRPPTSGSDFTNTYLALRGLVEFGTEDQKSQIETRRKRVQAWLIATSAKETEDRVFRLRALTQVESDQAALQEAVDQHVAAQRADGGWAQKDEMESDAYATATVLAALLQDGRLPATHAAVQRGMKYLLDTQLEDGSWHVVTRAQGFQKYYETGFPHGKDQFISTAASGWAVLALVLALPTEP